MLYRCLSEYSKDLCAGRVDWCIAHVAYRCKDWQNSSTVCKLKKIEVCVLHAPSDVAIPHAITQGMAGQGQVVDVTQPQ